MLTAKKTEWALDINNPDFSDYADDYSDDDGDGLTNHMENLYGLDSNKWDTDDDGYSDLEEFTFGWDPFDPVPGENQSREVLEKAIYIENDSSYNKTMDDTTSNKKKNPDNDYSADMETRITTEKEDTEPKNLVRNYSVTDKNIPDSTFLEKTLNRMNRVFTEEIRLGELILLLFSVFALGFLHASMPGHGKGILVAYLAEKSKKFRHALAFIGMFTLTHLIDVILLGAAFSIFSAAVNTAKVSDALNSMGGAGLFIISCFLIIRGIIRIQRKNGKKKPEQEKKKQKYNPEKRIDISSAFVAGLFTGLAPCPFGWALLMMLISLGKMAMVPLVILFFGLGIFIFLFVITLAIFCLKFFTFDIFSKLEKYSQLVSGILMLVFSFFFLTQKIIF